MPINVRAAWAHTLNRQDLVGGELEHHEIPEGTFRGPIKAIKLEGNFLIIVTTWTAHIFTNQHGMPLPGASWKRYTGNNSNLFKYEINTVQGMGAITSIPRSIGGGRLHFTSMLGVVGVTIFPKGGSKLDKAKVAGF